ncbi:MAG: DNA-binding protein WhiA [Firmicutes bacterium]|nr:DNA-binding protein WhiA [Bacillota bacterium]
MSFSSGVKERLCECRGKCANCVAAETAGILLFGGRVSGGIQFTTENEKIAKRLQRDIYESAGLETEYVKKPGANQFNIDGAAAETVKKAVDWMPRAKRCCKSAYARGAFLGGGSVTDPKRSYHLEMNTRDAEQIGVLKEIFEQGGIAVKITRRKDMYVAYIKDCETIADALGFMGAQSMALDMFSIQVEKELRNGINRRVNCETANTDKLITASSKHLAAIQKIKTAGKWSKLPETLREIGELRERYPEVSLKELGEKTNPPIGKSGVNHRLNRIIKIAEDEK